ncbi:MAG: DUF6106 family protein [Firmicutes bacterium]|nr:DUF6106 family protein [Bacillota bacterium]
MDIFIEHIVKRQKTAKDALVTVGLIIAVLIVAVFALQFPFGPIIVVAAGYGAYWLITGRNIEFEYIVTNGELDVDKIIAQRKRKRILSVHSKEFEIMAPVHDEKYKRDFTNVNIQKTIEAMSSMRAENLYFAVFKLNGVRTKLIFEPTEKMLNAFKKYNPRQVHLKNQ